MKKDEALKLALEALQSCEPYTISDGGRQWHDDKLVESAITAIKESLAQPEHQPVAELLKQSRANFERNFGKVSAADWVYDDITELLSEHTSPPQRKPLTDEQRREVYKKAEAQLYTVPNKPWLDALIEQTEIAHGIKGDA